ncbi:MAG: insulinase family protein [Phycisphaerae bacterium]|nr:insulinase family protein [Phycisphaerae bacterium]
MDWIRSVVVTVSVLVSAMSGLRSARAGEPPAASPALPSHERVVSGELPNGLGYMVLRHPNPAGHATAWLLVRSGSLNETDRQRGVAHFIEHLAFNGSEHFPPGSVIPLFQSLGLTFGRHQNASTGFDRTLYTLEMPETKPETIEKGLLFLSDVAFGLTFPPDEIEKERPIILEEKRARLSLQQRGAEAQLGVMAAGSRVPARIPIGVDTTIMGMTRDDFVAYYRAWYVPSNMTLLIAVDGETAPVLELVRKHFSKGERVARPTPMDPAVKATDAVSARVLTDAERTRANVSLTRVTPVAPPTLTEADLRRELVERMATAAFARRVQVKVNRGGMSLLNASATAADLYGAMRTERVSGDFEQKAWKPALMELTFELRRAQMHGFTEREIEDMRKDLLSAADDSAEKEATIPAAAVLMSLAASVVGGDAVMSASGRAAVVRRLAPTITTEEVNSVFAGMFDPSKLVTILEVSDKEPKISEKELAAAVADAMRVSPDREEERPRALTLLPTLPTPGEVAESSEHPASGVWSGWLSNGVRVHHKKVDTRKSDVTVLFTFPGGALLETAANRGVADAAVLAWSVPETRELTNADIRGLLAGMKGTARANAGVDSVTLNLSGNPADIEKGLQLVHLLFTQPKLTDASLERWKKNQAMGIERREKDPQGSFISAVYRALYPEGDVRPQPLTRAQVDAVTVDAAQAYLDRLIRESPLEVAVVGDIERAPAVDLIRTYIGSLPKRERISSQTLAAVRRAPAPSGDRNARAELATATPQAYVMCGFYAADADDLEAVRALELAQTILTTRLVERVREKEGLVYSIQARSAPGRLFPGYGLFEARVPTDPAKVERLIAVIEEEFGRFAKDGPTDAEMDTARKQLVTQFTESMERPEFWAGQLAALEFRGVKLDDLLSAESRMASVTATTARETFARFHSKGPRLRVVQVPVPSPQGSEGPPVGGAAPKGK